MPSYNAPIRDFTFALNEWLQLEQYSHIKGFEDLSIIDPILEEGARFCEEVLHPLNQTGDAQGLKFENGKVTLPDGFVDAYKLYVESGWGSFACNPEYGGQGLPNVINTPLIEMVCSSNLSFGLMPGLTHGAYSALNLFGTEEQKQKYLPKMITGEWTGVMGLTEPQSGTDLGLNRTRAEPVDPEAPVGETDYKITGTKIFISCGEHDAVDNIIHLVLARLPDAPEGVKGISLFVVPKVMVNDDGSLGEPNALSCGSIEHKMGIHASPTCVMNFEGATGWLVGEPHKGLKAMFIMMNEARLLVGVQGLGVGEVSYQNALAYARERLQGRALKGAALPDKPADPLTVHPDVRRMLLTMRAFAEGGRVLALWTALNVDLAHHSEDEEEREAADDFVQLMTPIVKSYLTEQGTKTANLGMQIHGGYGYITEYGMEQFVRDARIAEIYEGANGIQALDLVGRKLGMHTGRYLRRFFHPVKEFLDTHRDNEAMAEFNKPLYQGFTSLQNASLLVAQKGLANPDEAAAASSDYLTMFALVTYGYIWARTALIAQEALAGGSTETEFYENKLATARFFMQKVLPEHYSLLAKINAGAAPLDMPGEVV